MIKHHVIPNTFAIGMTCGFTANLFETKIDESLTDLSILIK